MATGQRERDRPSSPDGLPRAPFSPWIDTGQGLGPCRTRRSNCLLPRSPCLFMAPGTAVRMEARLGGRKAPAQSGQGLSRGF